jgi:uncharacterized protein YecT (DUF1311 family)
MLLGTAGPAIAQEEADCEAATTQSDMTACAQQEYEAADEELNRAYRKAMTRAQETDNSLADGDMAGAADALKTAQRAWIGYRDGHCELEGFSARGGSLEPMLVAGCLAGLTQARTRELDAVLVEP